ncbi:GyrI-like domain-containing protein [Paenibacillus sp. FSL R5-0887]|uniref:GyrI-like domain-containing protein n=1 Tax=Paenibacillus sp. FSL R5-0887 TaxID=2921662 RepID=UPI0040470581
MCRVYNTSSGYFNGYRANRVCPSHKKRWKYIFEEWFKDSGYVYDETKLDFEFYDEQRHSRPDTVMEIYVPVKKLTE